MGFLGDTRVEIVEEPRRPPDVYERVQALSGAKMTPETIAKVRALDRDPETWRARRADPELAHAIRGLLADIHRAHRQAYIVRPAHRYIWNNGRLQRVSEKTWHWLLRTGRLGGRPR